jgi:uncharacterized protein YbcI
MRRFFLCLTAAPKALFTSSIMTASHLTMAQRVERAASESQQMRAGLAPTAVTAVVSENTLVITLHDALSPAEKALARTPQGAVQVQDFHRQLFQSSVDGLRSEIKRITGVAVREAAVEIETSASAVVQIFTSGTMVQVFQLAGVISALDWNASAPLEAS